MSRPNPNTVWARTFVDAIVRAGVREACLAPGSRSTPLVLALAGHPRIRTRVHLDERCASYFALGVAKRSGRPVAVVTTSGTAAANLLPAAVEASQSGAPLLLCTADRPPRLRGQDANQTVDQNRLFGPHVRLYHDPGLPRLEERDLESLDALAFRAVAAALGPPAGPVHLNFPFQKPLEPSSPGPVPTEDTPPPRGRAGRRRVETGLRRLEPGVLDEVAEALAGAERGLIACGPVPRPGRSGAAALRLAEATGFPLLADPLSGARFAPGAEARSVGGYDLFLHDDEIASKLAPDLVLRIGAASASRALGEFLTAHGPPDQIVVDSGHLWKDHRSLASLYLHADPARTCDALAERLGAGPGRPVGRETGEWARRWRSAELSARRALDTVLDGAPFEGAAVAEVASALPEGGTLFVGNSMPVRDLEAFARPRDAALTVVGNRGASGIDGTVSTAFGAAATARAPAAAVLGDLALYHDMNGLLAARKFGIDLCLVVIDNDGGGIFHTLPIREFEPPFTSHFATPHGLDFRHAARLYDLSFVEVADRAGVREALETWLADGGPRLVRVASDREENRGRRRRAVEEVARAVRSALGSTGRTPPPGS